MFDILTVVFQKELPFLQLQAKSIETYINANELNNIVIVVNDREDVCHNIDPAWYGTNSHKVKIIHYRQFGYEYPEVEDPNWAHSTVGWENQQLCKLYGAGLSSADWTMVLDAKSVFINEFSIAKTMVGNKIAVRFADVHTLFESSQKLVESLFNVSMEQVPTIGIPAWIHTATVKELVEVCEQLTGEKFSTYFIRMSAHPTRLTEFYIYAGFVLHKYGTYDALYHDLTPQSEYVNSAPGVTPYVSINIASWEYPEFDRKLALMHSNNAIIGMVHREAWRNLTDTQKDAWANFLLSKHIITVTKETKNALNNM